MAPKVKLTLNTEDATPLKDAVKRKKASNETLAEAWQRLASLKNNATDQRMLAEVKAAMEEGKIGREADAVAGNKRLSKAEVKRLWVQVKEIHKQEVLDDMVANMPDNYWLIQTVERLDEFLAILDDEDEAAFDVETSGTNVWQDYLVGHVLGAVKADIHAYIPVRHNTKETQLDADYVKERLRPYYENQNLKKVAHNGKFDIHVLDREGISLKGLNWDTQEAMKLLNENEPRYALKKLVTKYLNIPSLTYSELFGKIGFQEVSSLIVAASYAIKDSDVTIKLKEFQLKHMKRFPEILEYYERVEVPFIETLFEMETTGYEIDLDFAERYAEDLCRNFEALRSDIFTIIGEVDLDSPAQLKATLNSCLGLKLESTDAKKALAPIANDYPVIADILAYKKQVKLYSTYFNVIPDLVDKATGKLHANFNGNGTKTGRLSSGKDEEATAKDGTVNLQNQPKPARIMYLAPKGYALVSGDWSQQEIRCLAYFTQEPVLLEAYRTGRDVYSSLAAETFNKTYEECGDGTTYRDAAKRVLLSIVYGTTKYGLSTQLKIDVSEAQILIDKVMSTMPNVVAFIKANNKSVDRQGYVSMDKNQRKRRLPEIKQNPSWSQKNRVHRQATNAIIQGSAAIQSKITMNALAQLCRTKRSKGKDWRIWCTIHDEAILQVPDNFTQDELIEFEDIMLNSYVFGNVPNKTDIAIMRRWGEGVTKEEWFKK
ncbi:DNA polymerase [Listeria booriae]|uniref:DNA polymerase I n=1 Tax=Listeria booriae TaxID=1552123 RepID=A0A7X0TL58_9LIST|nr:DNA polymerase [Listeria booriae]MBC1331103.1 DNA polymerase I [Listeria booriae]